MHPSGTIMCSKVPEERPLMLSVLVTLDSENAALPQPKEPGFYTEKAFIKNNSSSTSIKPNVSLFYTNS